ncbi:MAG TPA: CHAP domain-containing protein [Chloroflexota bacterium]|nr:CHAP domain-containing protein [Chloroflexota bacterium]
MLSFNQISARGRTQPVQHQQVVDSRPVLLLWQTIIAIASVCVLTASAVVSPRPGYAYAYNCVNVVLRDPYWGQYRHIVESGWNAAGIAPRFAQNGWVVDGTPSACAIMSWPPGYYGASNVGHVGVVVEVYDGSVLVRHENWPYGSGERLQTFPLRPGYQFVHKPDAALAHAVIAGTEAEVPAESAEEAV